MTRSDSAQSKLAVICGSREWPEDALWFVTAKIIEHVPRDWTVITGGARGIDSFAHQEAVRLGYATEVMRANWRPSGGAYNPRAGFERNLAMLDRQPALVLAFHAKNSNGTAHTIRNAWKRQIECIAYTESALRSEPETLDV